MKEKKLSESEDSISLKIIRCFDVSLWVGSIGTKKKCSFKNKIRKTNTAEKEKKHIETIDYDPSVLQVNCDKNE